MYRWTVADLQGLYPDGPTNAQREEIAHSGIRIVKGRGAASDFLYCPARRSGGYDAIPTAAPDGWRVVPVTRGCSAYLGEVALVRAE